MGTSPSTKKVYSTKMQGVMQGLWRVNRKISHTRYTSCQLIHFDFYSNTVVWWALKRPRYPCLQKEWPCTFQDLSGRQDTTLVIWEILQCHTVRASFVNMWYKVLLKSRGKQISRLLRWDSNPGPLHSNADALTTRPPPCWVTRGQFKSCNKQRVM